MPLWPLIVARLIEGIKRIIDSEGGEIAGYLSYGHAWFPADSRYLRRKQREGHGSVDLLYSGRLISQITTVAGVRRCTPRQLIFGTRGLKYVQLLNFVKRPFFGMSQSMESEVADLMSGYLSQVANRACRAAGGAR
jgi:phage gpG-like protein